MVVGASLALFAAFPLWVVIFFLAGRLLRRLSASDGRWTGFGGSLATISFTSAGWAGAAARAGRRPCLRRFYAAGGYVGAAGIPAAVLLLSLNLFSNLSTLLQSHRGIAPSSVSPVPNAAPQDGGLSGPPPAYAMTPLLPGVNLPLSHGAFLLAAVFISLVVHEAGHAMAAGAEGVRVLAAGVFLTGGVIPGAYILLDPDLDIAPASKAAPHPLPNPEF
ncbi:hypothetical protein T484DRAFT_1808211 [Baffinella frigidus]|nr:hypothetical protein T484DRAFT_1808211 [Cryptophyta sp. CCMP2293]